MTEPKKMDLKSMDIPEDKKEQLRQLFPEVFTEKKIDFEKLKLVLGEAIETGKERYGLNWAGKADCFKIIQQPSVGTLKPCREESIDFDNTENLFIEGDNLEVLKLLQKAYYGRIKMMYFDPPYNTGNDFIYPDNYSESLDTYLKYTGQVDSEGRKYSTNTEADGRFHTKWLNMMYPRLYLARNLLSDNGVIFISIDDKESSNLRKLMDEIFGEDNFIACIANINNPKGRSDDKYIPTAHEYLLVYRKKDVLFYGWEAEDNVIKRYNKVDSRGEKYREIDLRKTGDTDRREDRPNLFYWFYYNPETKDFYASREDEDKKGYTKIVPLREDGSEGNWRWELKTANNNLSRLVPKLMPVRKVWSVFEMDYLDPNERIKPTSAWTKKEFNTERGSEQFIELGFDKTIFPRPKPVGLIMRILETATNKESGDIILDIFAGSGTTAHAVLEMNQIDGGNRRFICIQLPETCDESSDAFKTGFRTIADIGKERTRRAIKKIKQEKEARLDLGGNEKQDLGFKVINLQQSNFKIWDTENAEDAKKLGEQLEFHVDHIDPKSTQEDILYELLLKSGFDLATKTEKLTLAGKTVYSIADGAMLVCLEEKLTKEVINAIAEMTPSRVICLDKGFKDNDQLKTNAVQIMKSKKVNTFMTV
jgi:adenine-specific DNA-methyltransferase